VNYFKSNNLAAITSVKKSDFASHLINTCNPFQSWKWSPSEFYSTYTLGILVSVLLLFLPKFLYKVQFNLAHTLNFM
jgi:hypothetical protein